MAPRGVAKARDYDYSNVGKQGRRTGITLKEGRRDEHGMEELDGVFSSPEKSPVRFTGNETMMGSEGMSIDEDDGPGPTDFLSRSAARRSPFFPPPVARSPRKSGLSGSPRRTPGLRSSPIAQNDVPSSPTSARQRRGRMNEDAAETTLARQPLNDRRPNTAPIANGSRQKGALSAYANDENLPINDDDEEEDEEINDVSVYQSEPIEEDYDVHEIGDDGYGDDAGEATPEDTTNVQNDDHSEEEPSPVQAASLRTKKRKAPATTDDVDTPAEDIPQSQPKKKRAGRPPKFQAQKATQEKTTEQRRAKKAKPSKPPPAKEREPLDPELEQVVENHVKRTGPLKGRSLYILKREVPTDQQAAHTRSGRVSVRPLAYWRNERCVYGDGEADLGQRYPLTTIKEIIRTEDIEPEKKGGKKRKGKKSKSKKHEEDSDHDDDERDKWEAEDGVLHGYIKKWDTDKQVASNEEEITEIAFAPSGVETRDVKDSTFRVAKLLSQPFFGSGIVELPAKGVKKPKNSKRMHMVFYVCYGRVQVDINGVQFTAGKGCIFQVPRGNHYSFANITPKEARLFFTQAFMPNGSDNDNDNEPASSSKPAAAEPEPEPEVEATEAERSKAPAAKGKGRGRGRKATAK